MNNESMTPEEQGLPNRKVEEPSSIAEPCVSDYSPLREGSHSAEISVAGVDNHPHEASPSHSINNDPDDLDDFDDSDDSDDSIDWEGSSNWRPAQRVIEELEQERSMENICSRMQLMPDTDDFKDEWSALTMEHSNIAPTEIDDAFGFQNKGPAVLTVRFQIPPSFTYTPEGLRKAVGTYTLTRSPFSVLLDRASPDFLPFALEMLLLDISKRDQPEYEQDGEDPEAKP